MIFQFSMSSLDLCTNSRLSDLEIAAAVVKGRKVKEGVRALVVPGSKRVRDAAMQKDYITYLKKRDLNGENLDVPCVLNESASST